MISLKKGEPVLLSSLNIHINFVRMNRAFLAALSALSTSAVMLTHEAASAHHHFQLEAGLSIPLEITVGDLAF